MYNNELSDSFDSRFLNIAAINDLEVEDLSAFKENDGINLDLGAIKYADGIISGSETMDDLVKMYSEAHGKPSIPNGEDIDASAQATVEFYKTLLAEENEN